MRIPTKKEGKFLKLIVEEEGRWGIAHFPDVNRETLRQMAEENWISIDSDGPWYFWVRMVEEGKKALSLYLLVES